MYPMCNVFLLADKMFENVFVCNHICWPTKICCKISYTVVAKKRKMSLSSILLTKSFYIFWPQHIWGSYKRDFAPDAFAFWSFKRCTLQIFWLWKRGKPLPSSSWIPQFQDSLHIITTILSSGPRWSPYHGWLQCQLGWPAWGMMTLYIEQQDSWMYSTFEKSYVMTIDELKLLGVWTCACSAWSWMSDCESGGWRLQVRTRIVW